MTCRYVLPQYLNLNREAFYSAAELPPARSVLGVPTQTRAAESKILPASIYTVLWLVMYTMAMRPGLATVYISDSVCQ
eukprot:COSAG06_NODE_52492_length_305_cov_0.796117_1_plen_78_part_10